MLLTWAQSFKTWKRKKNNIALMSQNIYRQQNYTISVLPLQVEGREVCKTFFTNKMFLGQHV